jgi:DNA-binding NtrC family response regulator
MRSPEARRFLVVDDEETIRGLLQRTLTKNGYNVDTAANGEEALDKLYQDNYGVVLLDIKMPGMSGIEILGKITTDWPDICVIMITATLDTQVAVDALKMGAYDYITKPFEQEDVLQKVQQAVLKWNQLMKDKYQYLELKERFREHTQKMQEQFTELVNSLAREHKLLYEISTKQAGGKQSLLSELPPELQKPISSEEEFRDALLKILRRT